MTAAFAAALGAMAGRYTLGRKEFDEVRVRVEKMVEELDMLRERFLDMAEADEAAYGAYDEASKLPKKTEEQRRARDAALRDAARKALEVPLEVARLACRTGDLGAEMVGICNPRLASDAAACALLASAACSTVLLSVDENASAAFGDSPEREGLESEVRALRNRAVRGAVEAKVAVWLREGKAGEGAS